MASEVPRFREFSAETRLNLEIKTASQRRFAAWQSQQVSDTPRVSRRYESRESVQSVFGTTGAAPYTQLPGVRLPPAIGEGAKFATKSGFRARLYSELADGSHGIGAHGSMRGKVACQQRHRSQQGHHSQYGHRIVGADSEQQSRDEARQPER